MVNKISSPEMLRDDLIKLSGVGVTISGMLIVDTSAHIELTGVSECIRLPIEDLTLVGRLLDKVPCHLGGNYLYHDLVQFNAIFELTENVLPIVSRVKSGVLTRDGEDFEF